MNGKTMQIASNVDIAVKCETLDQPPSETKLISRKYISNIFTITMAVVGVLWVAVGALRLMNILVFFPATIVSWILYFLVVVVIGIGVWGGVVYANTQAATCHFFYEKVREGLIVWHTFMDEGKYTHQVHVNLVGKNFVGEERHDTATISLDEWREGGYANGKKISID